MSRLKNSYNSQDIVGLLAVEHSLPKETTNKVVSSFFKNLVKIVKKEGRVKVDGFGTFESFIRNSKRKPPSNTIRFMPSVICEKELNSSNFIEKEPT